MARQNCVLRLGWGKSLSPMSPATPLACFFYLFFFGPTALCPCHPAFKQKSSSCSLCPHPVLQENKLSLLYLQSMD